MLQRVIAVIAGTVAAVVTVGVVEGVGHAVFPPPPGIDIADPAALADVMHRIPLGAKVAVVLAWAMGSLVGGWVAARFSRDRRVGASLVVGLLMLAAGGYTIAAIPHPRWMASLGLLLPLPMAWLGARLRAGA
ncbi:MAG: hypothetical protein R2729_08775 [Bryobacteraceae bacterium]